MLKIGEFGFGMTSLKAHLLANKYIPSLDPHTHTHAHIFPRWDIYTDLDSFLADLPYSPNHNFCGPLRHSVPATPLSSETNNFKWLKRHLNSLLLC